MGLMRILALRLQEVGRFGRGVEIGGFGDGLNVLSAPNETGKSTLFRALSAVFRLAHSSRAEAVRALQPNAGGAPLIECEFEISGESWRLRKQYLAGRAAVLSRLDGGEVHRGGEAEDRLGVLLAGAGGLGESMAQLWVAQGGSFAPPVFDQALRSSFADLVQDEIDRTSGAGRLGEVLRLVEKDLFGLVTESRGRPKTGGAYAKALDAFNAAKEAYEVARAKAEQAEGRRCKLKALIEQEEVLMAPGAAAQRQDMAVARRKEYEAGRVARSKLEVATANAAGCEERHRTAQAALQAFETALAEYRAGLARQSEIEGARVRLQESIEAAAAEQLAREYMASRLRAEQEALQAARIAAEQAIRHAEGRRRSAELERRLVEVRANEAALAALRAEYKGHHVRPEDVAQLRKLEDEIRLLEHQAEAVAPELRVAYVGAGDGRFRISGDVLADGCAVAVTEETVLSADGVGDITIVPGAIADVARRIEDRDGCVTQRDELLARLGVSGRQEAEALLEKAGEVAYRGRELAVLIKSQAPDGLAALEQEYAEVNAVLGELDVADGDAAAAQDGQSADLQARLAQTAAALAEAERERVAGAAALASKREELVRLESEFANIRQRLAVLAEQLPEHEDARAAKAGELRSAVADAEAALNAAVRERQAWLEAAPDDAAMVALSEAVEHSQRMVELAQQQVTTLREERRGIEGALQRDVEDGVGAEAAVQQERMERLARQVEEIERECAALRLLRDEILAVLETQRSLIAAPLVRRMQSLAMHVFPDVRLEVDDDFAVKAVTREGRDEAFAQLSDGTREQIAVLARLALASCLADAREALPVVFDDALVFTDDRRLDGLFEVLAGAAAKHQIIMLTCHERSFAPLRDRHGATALSLAPWAGN